MLFIYLSESSFKGLGGNSSAGCAPDLLRFLNLKQKKTPPIVIARKSVPTTTPTISPVETPEPFFDFTATIVFSLEMTSSSPLGISS